MDVLVTLAVVAVIVVLIFDYTNGFHDASNIIATVIASRAMTPVQAVIIVATFEFLGPLLGGTAVANTIGKFVDIGDLSDFEAADRLRRPGRDLYAEHWTSRRRHGSGAGGQDAGAIGRVDSTLPAGRLWNPIFPLEACSAVGRCNTQRQHAVLVRL